MELDIHTQEQIKKRMQELSNDSSFTKQLDKEIANLKGRNLKKYIKEAVKKSEHEVRSRN